MPSSSPQSAGWSQSRILQVCLALLVLGVVLLGLPLWPWIILGLWTAGLLSRPTKRLSRAMGGRSRAASLVTLALLIGILLPIAAGIGVLIPDLLHLVDSALASKSGHETLVSIVSSNGGSPGKDPEKWLELLKAHGTQAMTVATTLAATAGTFALGVLIYFVSTYAALVRGDTAYAYMRSRLPITGESADRLRATFQETGRGLLFSVALTALAQAALATIAYVSLGLPRPFALGLLTFVTSVIPAIGPFLVWGPLALGLLIAGHTIKAAILAAVCAIIVAPADNVLRPLFAKWGNLKLDPFLVFFSMLAGILTLGGWGLMLGPLLFRMALEVTEMVRETRDQQKVGSLPVASQQRSG
jgi:predicted PurR-regulated permease PerM